MNKICTSIEQSKKLIELGIDVNTADVCYHIYPCEDLTYEILLGVEPINDDIPAWSLTALRAFLPPGINSDGILYVFESHNTFDNKWVYEYKFEDSALLYSKSSNEIDAAFEMICCLKENNKI